MFNPRRREINLAGGYYCSLTEDEQNRWHEYIESTKEFAEQAVLENYSKVLNLQCIARVITAEEIQIRTLNIAEQADVNNRKIYQLAKKWHIELKIANEAYDKEEEEKAIVERENPIVEIAAANNKS